MAKLGPDEKLLGRTIAGKFLIDSYVGGGAMGAVYKAKQFALDKIVAIKVMHHDIAKDEKFVARFKREAKAASKLDHPNSLRIIDFGEEPDGLLYIAMEYLDGRDLFSVIKESWPLRDERLVDIMLQALAALAIAHDMGVVHRDLKPENIMILAGHDDEGNPRDIVKVCDFGIAKLTESRKDKSVDTGRLSTKGLVVGTPEYMSPEQGRGEELDSRSDLYSMGVILFQLLTRQVPFDAENAIGIVLKHVTEEPRNPRDIYAAVNPKLEAICLRAMKKKRDERYQTAREMRTELRMALDGKTTGNYSLPMHPTRTSGAVLVEPSLASAATVPLDPADILAAEREHAGPEKETPLSTEALDRPAGVPNRWTGYVLAFALIASVVGTGTYLTRSYLVTANTLPTVTVTPTAPPPVTATTGGAIHADPTATTAAAVSTNLSSHVGTTASSHVPTTLASRDAGAHDAATAVSATADASAVVVAPVADAGAPTSASGPTVKIGVPHNAVGVDGSKVRVALASMYEQLNACFAKGIKSGDAAAPSTMKMHLDFDASSVSVGMGVPSTLASTGPCIVNVAKRIHVDGTGSVDVDFELVP